MKILGIETSCDETSAAVIETQGKNKKVILLSNVTASSLSLHAKTGGIIPEIAAREQIKFILPVIDKTLKDAKISEKDLDAIAVTVGPGLIGSLLVGVETSKTFSFVWNKPIIPVNHLFGHVYANWITMESKRQTEKKTDKQSAISHMPYADIDFPSLCLIVSGGHTDLVLMENHGKTQWISGTRDDAAGEAFDKIGRLLGLPYPAGPVIEKLALKGNPKAYHFPRPLLHEKTLDFSFSGLKTAVLREVQRIKNLDERIITDIARATQDAIIDVLVTKTLNAAEKYHVKSILLSGGVAANQALIEKFKLDARSLTPDAKIFYPPKNLCTDNAAMIASAAFYNYQEIPWQEVTSNPELYFD